jgi:hypothetical protein
VFGGYLIFKEPLVWAITEKNQNKTTSLHFTSGVFFFFWGGGYKSE